MYHHREEHYFSEKTHYPGVKNGSVQGRERHIINMYTYILVYS
jgi:hypothetical protein